MLSLRLCEPKTTKRTLIFIKFTYQNTTWNFLQIKYVFSETRIVSLALTCHILKNPCFGRIPKRLPSTKWMNEWMINRLPIVRTFTECAFVLVTTGRYLWLVSAKANTTLKPFRQLSIWIFLKVDVIALFTCVFIDGKIFQNRRVSSPAPVTIVCKRPYSWDFQRGNCLWRSSS